MSYAYENLTSSFNAFTGTKSRAVIVPAQTVDVRYSTTAAAPGSVSGQINQLRLDVPVAKNQVLRRLQFSLGGSTYDAMPDGALMRDISPTTGAGTGAGNVMEATGEVIVQSWPTGAVNALSAVSMLQTPPSDGPSAPYAADTVTFRTASAPLRPGSVQVRGTLLDGTDFSVTSNPDGKFNGTRVKGRVNYETGLVELWFVNPSNSNPTAATVDLAFLGIAGVASLPIDLCRASTVIYNAVAYAYLPLDANLLGIDPVRLPSDGRVPIYRAGGFVVVGHTGRITASVSNGQTINCARVRLSRVRVVGNDGIVINTGYTTDLEAGTVTFANVAGYSQPVTIEHRIEDMALVREVQINGSITLTRPLTHDYPVAAGADKGAFVSSAFVAGDLFARVQSVYDQQTWTNVWSDDVIGLSATGTFNHALYPITVSNRGAVTERWLIRFTNSTAFEVIGEHTGVIATGNTATDCAPNNPATGVPYFTIPALGWGAGWVAGNCLRINTIGAQVPLWVVRTVQQGPETAPDDSFTLLIRGDVDRP